MSWRMCVYLFDNIRNLKFGDEYLFELKGTTVVLNEAYSSIRSQYRFNRDRQIYN